MTDAGIEPLTSLAQLRILDLESTRITDAGLAQLKSMKSLHRLYVKGTQVTDAGIAELRRTLPGLEVDL